MQLARRNFLKRFGYGVMGTGAMAGGTFAYGTRLETEWLKLERIEIPFERLDPALERFRIALLSDFHLFPNTRIELIRRAVEMANSVKPDLVAMVGDFVQRDVEAIFELAPVLAGLDAKYGVFSTLGNHDHWKGAERVIEGLARSGLTVFQNRGVALEVGSSLLYVAGVDDGWVGREDLAAALDARPENAFTLVLMHEPDFADQFSRDGRIHLQLSGHSHGGQVRFPLIGSPFLPPYGEKYDQGFYRVGDLRLYTTRGVGVTAPIRINCRPEVTEITLVRA